MTKRKKGSSKITITMPRGFRLTRVGKMPHFMSPSGKLFKLSLVPTGKLKAAMARGRRK